MRSSASPSPFAFGALHCSPYGQQARVVDACPCNRATGGSLHGQPACLGRRPHRLRLPCFVIFQAFCGKPSLHGQLASGLASRLTTLGLPPAPVGACTAEAPTPHSWFSELRPAPCAAATQKQLAPGVKFAVFGVSCRQLLGRPHLHDECCLCKFARECLRKVAAVQGVTTSAEFSGPLVRAAHSRAAPHTILVQWGNIACKPWRVTWPAGRITGTMMLCTSGAAEQDLAVPGAAGHAAVLAQRPEHVGPAGPNPVPAGTGACQL